MKPGRELNTKIATEVFGYRVFKHKGALSEDHPLGVRPLRNYSNDIQWAWEVAEKMKVCLVPVPTGEWFAFIGPEMKNGWESPKEALSFLEAGQFEGAGAAVHSNVALAICTAALNAVSKRKASSVVHVLEEADVAGPIQ